MAQIISIALLHFSVAKKQSIITTNSAEIALLRKVGGEITTFTKSVTKMVPALSKQYHLINCVSSNNSNTFFLSWRVRAHLRLLSAITEETKLPLLATLDHLRDLWSCLK